MIGRIPGGLLRDGGGSGTRSTTLPHFKHDMTRSVRLTAVKTKDARDHHVATGFLCSFRSNKRIRSVVFAAFLLWNQEVSATIRLYV